MTDTASGPGSPLWHIPIALAAQAVCTLPFLHHLTPATIILAALPGQMWCFAREQAQAEYNYIQSHGGLRANMPSWEGVKFWKWNAHSIRETAFALVAGVVATGLMLKFA